MATKKKLLFVVSNSAIGGPQKSLLALLDKIDYDRFSVSIYVLRPGGELEAYFNPNAHVLTSNPVITAATIPARNTFHWLRVLLFARRLGLLMSSIAAILRHLLGGRTMNRERQRVWQRHAAQLPTIEGSYDAAFGILGMSSYAVVDCVEARRRYHWVRSDSRILDRDVEIDGSYFRAMDGALAVSKDVATIFEDMYPFMSGRVSVFYNHIPVQFYSKQAADLSLMACPDGRVKILTICRLDPLKGIEMAIEACRMLVDRGTAVCWFVLGDGVSRSEIEHMIAANGLQEHFRLLGFQLNTLAFIGACDIFVHPSRTEGKANVVDEAKFVGKPIVVTNYATVGSQIVHEETGLICEMSGSSIAESVVRLVENQELRGRLVRDCIGHDDGTADVNGFFDSLCGG